MVLDIDLNELSTEARQAEECAALPEARRAVQSATPVDLQHEHPPTGSCLTASPITADAIDDELILLTASEWPLEAKNQRKRKRPVTSVIDVNLGTNAERSGYAVDETVTALHPDCQQASNTGISKLKALQPIPGLPEGTSSSIDEGTLICAVCMCRLNEPISTNCGHVFCCCCIENVLRRQKKCPICRKRLTKRSYHRIYLLST